METVTEQLRVDLKKQYKDALHKMIDEVDDEEVLQYLFFFDFQVVSDHAGTLPEEEDGEDDD